MAGYSSVGGRERFGLRSRLLKQDQVHPERETKEAESEAEQVHLSRDLGTISGF